MPSSVNQLLNKRRKMELRATLFFTLIFISMLGMTTFAVHTKQECTKFAIEHGIEPENIKEIC